MKFPGFYISNFSDANIYKINNQFYSDSNMKSEIK